MNYKRKAVSTAVLIALGAAAALPSFAQETLERVTITGSSIKRIAAEGAVPIQVLTSADIARSGATTVTDLIQKLPAMQGFSVTTTAVGTNSGGRTTASIHDLGEEYTLTLLNGRRVAPSGSGSAVNLNAIPMSAIERVEVVTDGASALYGSDAIAGVVNFILKRNYQGGDLDFRMDRPSGGGESWNASGTWGFGDLEKDRFNVLLSYRHDEQRQLLATDRDFAKSAFINFENNGKQYFYNRGAPHAIPGNVSVALTGGIYANQYTAFNPEYEKTGKCAPAHELFVQANPFAQGKDAQCYFDFASTLEIFPESSRDSFFGTANFMLTPNTRLFADLSLSRHDLTAKIAANAVNIPIAKGSAQYNTYVRPYLGSIPDANVSSVTATYRMLDFGGRTSQTVTDSTHFVVGGESEIAGWNVSGGLTYSKNDINEKYVDGYSLRTPTNALLASGELNPFALAGQQTPQTLEKIRAAIFNGSVRTEQTELTGADVRASGSVFKLPGGDAMLGVGGDVRNYHFSQIPTEAARTSTVLFNFAAIPQFNLERKTAGAFAELLMPVSKQLELTAAMRYDTIDGVTNKDTGATVSEDMSASTYKISARYQPSRELMFRTSYGTGFKAPSMLDVARPRTPSGVTSNPYTCPFPATEFCKPGRAQYQRLSEGNALLKPERSKQFLLGMRFEPTNAVSVGMDYWNVEMRDQVSSVSEALAFGNPATYKDLFTTFTDPGDGKNYYAFKLASVNIGRAKNSGIDWDITGRVDTGLGRLTTTVSGTYLIESSYTRPGTSDVWESSLGKFGVNNAVSFRNILRASASLQSGKFTNTLSFNYRSGYSDMERTDVIDVAASAAAKRPVLAPAMRLQVPEYYTFDWLTQYKHNKALDFQFGIKNLFDQAPPLSLRTGGSHHVGYDPRYTDSFLRTFYGRVAYKF